MGRQHAQQAFDLARAAAANEYGRFGANLLAPRDFGRFTQEFGASEELGQQDGYMNFLQRKFGL